MLKAVKVSVRGRVQGVGFRPFVFQLANEYQLKGTVQNNMDGVKIQLEGQEKQVQAFLVNLPKKAPRFSNINEILVAESKVQKLTDFRIIESERIGTSMLVIPVDLAVCEDCLYEMNNPDNFRFQYPFINCTQCGPRYTIINELPYDRPFTTMKGFQMCPECKKEYEDPANRRHHAQPTACPECGPKVQLLNSKGEEVLTTNPMQKAIALLKEGKIIAVKGIGGYHLCCDAANEKAVADLRKRKVRPIRPLAIMAAHSKAVEEIAEVSQTEKFLLKSPEAPIVILKKKEPFHLSSKVAPGMKTIGVMLPYTPVHHLLFTDPELPYLVMTSANPSGLPILYRDWEVFTYLDGIADYYLVNNREILHPVDDSVLQVIDGKTDFLRRSRGYVPDPFVTNQDVSGIVAFGGQQKNTFTIGKNKQIFLSPHIGDLENVETINHYKHEMEHLLRWIDTPKSIAAIDAHPGYNIRNLALDDHFETVIEVQHHHAHMAACLAEHEIAEKAFGIILDGTGYGLDGNIWGFEIFHGDAGGFRRLAHLHYTPLPGSEKCIHEPWRNAAAMLLALLGAEGESLAKQIFSDKTVEIEILKRMIEKNINTVQAGTCGRLFDAVSAICGVTKISSYDGEAAIRLSEYAAEGQSVSIYPFELSKKDELLTFDFSAMIKQIALDVLNGQETAAISCRFHETLVEAIVRAMLRLQSELPSADKTVVLSGGSFHNRYLRSRLQTELSKKGFKVFVPEKIPCNDGGLSYGQLVVAAARRRAGECV